MSKNLELALRIAANVTGDKDLVKMASAVRDVGKGAAEADPKTDALAQKMDRLSNQQRLISEFERSKKALDANEIAVTAVAMRLQKLQKDAQDTSQPFTVLAKNIDAAEKELTQMRNELAQNASRHTTLQAALKKSGVDTRVLGTEKRRVQNELKKTSAETRKLGSDYLRANGQQSQFSRGASNLTGRLVALAGTYLGLNRLRQTITSIFQTGSQFEKLDVQFAALMGSLEGGAEATAWVKEFAKNTPMQLEEVSRAFVRLKAFGLDPMDGSLQAVVDQAFKLGGSFQEVESIALGLGQAWAKQKLQGQEIMQLLNQGVPVWDLLAKVTGKNTAELQKLSEQGALGRDVIKALMEEMGRQSEGAAVANMKLLSGLISNAQDNLSQFYNMIATSGAMDWLKGQLETLNSEFERMAADGSLQEWAKNISDTLVSIGEGVKTTVSTLYEFKGTVASVIALWATLKVGRFFVDLVTGSRNAVAGLLRLIGTKKAAALANKLYGVTLVSVTAALGKARAATLAWMASLTGLSAMLAKTGIWAGIVYGVYQIGTLVKALWDYKGSVDNLKESQQDLAEQEALWANELEQLNLRLSTNFQTRQQLNQAIDDGLLVMNQETGLWEHATKVLQNQTMTLQDYRAVWNSTADDIEEAYKQLGIASTASLQETAENFRQAYEAIRAGNEPIEQQRAAFLKYAEAALIAAKATGTAIPESVRLTAASLGLALQLDDLVKKQGLAAESSKSYTQSVGILRQEVDKTKATIALYQSVIESETASIEEKRQATLRLVQAQNLLKEQLQTLTEIESLRTANYFEVKLALEEAQRELERLNESYRAGTINTEQYNEQLQRQLMLVQALQQLMGQAVLYPAEMAGSQKDAQQSVARTNTSISQQSESLDDLTNQTEAATTATSLYASAQAYLTEQFNFANTSSEDLAKRYSELTWMIDQNRRVHNVWWRELAQVSNQGFLREKQIISETLQVRRFTAELQNSAITLEQIRRIAHVTDTTFSQLGANELAPLRNAIAQAEQRILSLRDGIQGTLASLQDELDRLNDNQDAIEERRYKQQQAELQAKLKVAQEAGDEEAIRAAEQALKLAREIYQVKKQQREEEVAEKLQREQERAEAAPRPTQPQSQVTSPAPAQTQATQQNATTGKTITLVVSLEGRSYQASMANNETNKSLAHLERVRSTSL